jgi:hypothetical protein
MLTFLRFSGRLKERTIRGTARVPFLFWPIVVARLVHLSLRLLAIQSITRLPTLRMGRFLMARYAMRTSRSLEHCIHLQFNLMRLLAPGRALFNACSFLKTGTMVCARAIQLVIPSLGI